MRHAMVKRTYIPIHEEPGPYREPALKEMLADPIVVALMRADDVNPVALSVMLDRIARTLRTRPTFTFSVTDGRRSSALAFHCQG